MAAAGCACRFRFRPLAHLAGRVSLSGGDASAPRNEFFARLFSDLESIAQAPGQDVALSATSARAMIRRSSIAGMCRSDAAISMLYP